MAVAFSRLFFNFIILVNGAFNSDTYILKNIIVCILTFSVNWVRLIGYLEGINKHLDQYLTFKYG